MQDTLSELVVDATHLASSPRQLLGIPFALVGAVLMSFGTQFQSRGLNLVEQSTNQSAGSGLTLTHVLHLLARPLWLAGTVMLGLAVAFQIASLSFSPLIVVQPLGVVALIVTAILNAKMNDLTLTAQTKWSIAACVGGIALFVGCAALNAVDKPITDTRLTLVSILFAAVLVGLLAIFFMVRHHSPAFFYIVASGILYAFVATFAKASLSRILVNGFDALTWLAIVCLVIGAVVGMVFVQNAHSSGPPDLVIAGLTVIDPIIAVLIGIVILGEAQHAPPWAYLVFVITGLIAVLGVFGIAKFHPQSVAQKGATQTR